MGKVRGIPGIKADFGFSSWDTRSDNYNKASQEVEGHSLEINSVAWNRAVGTLLLTGSSDNVRSLKYLDPKTFY